MKPKIQIQEWTPEYVRREYGITPKEFAAFKKRVAREIAADRKAGRLVEFTGKLTPDNPHTKPARKPAEPKRPGKPEKKARTIYDEKQIEFRKQANGRWTMLIHEPLASRVRKLCKRRKISTREYLLGLLQSPNQTRNAPEKGMKNTKPVAKKSAQDWKSIVLTTHLWPRTLAVPQRANMPPGSISLRCLFSENEDWDYQLIRGPGGRSYYLRVWARDYKGEKWDENPTAPAARLTPEEAFRFAVANLVPREILEDCPDQTAAVLKK